MAIFLEKTIRMRLVIAGIRELPLYAGTIFSHVVSFFDANAGIVAGAGLLRDFARHARIEFRFDDVTCEYPGYRPPTRAEIYDLLRFARDFDPDSHVLVHCVAGISRSTAAASLILMQANPELPAAVAFDRIAALRPIAYPNELMLEHGGALLRRQDEIMIAFYRKFDLSGSS